MKLKQYLFSAFVFICAVTNAQYEIVHNFSAASKAYPDGSLVSDGNFIYRMTESGEIITAKKLYLTIDKKI
jgi:hypothetical protein